MQNSLCRWKHSRHQGQSANEVPQEPVLILSVSHDTTSNDRSVLDADRSS